MEEIAKKVSLLVIEDDKDTAETLRRWLAELGFETTVSHNRDNAAERLAEIKPNVILLDYWMPGMSASVFVNRCRSLYPSAKIIVITAVRDAPGIANMLDADAYFGKPLDFDKFGEFLRQV